MIDAGSHALRGAQAEAHIDIADLRHRRIGDHPPDITLPDSVNGTHDHAGDTERKQHMDHLASAEHVKTDDPIKNLHQQENIALGHQRGQDRRRGHSRVSVGIRQPGVKGKQGALDGQTHAHQTDGHQQGPLVLSAGYQSMNALLNIAHEQVPRQVIQKA